MSERLIYRVQCRGRELGGWETIAAFNVAEAAHAYAQRCAKQNNEWMLYRVQKRGKTMVAWEPIK